MARKARPSDSYTAKKARAARLGFPSVRAMRQAGPRPGKSLTAQQFERRDRAFASVARARREGVPISEAARREGVSMHAVKQWAPGAVESKRGRYVATPSDQLARPMMLITTQGRRDATVRSSRKASTVGLHYDAIKSYLETGDSVDLESFRGTRVAGYELEGDPDRIYDLFDAGTLHDVSIEGIYRWERAA